MSGSNVDLDERRVEAFGWRVRLEESRSPELLPLPTNRKRLAAAFKRRARQTVITAIHSAPVHLEMERAYGHLFTFSPLLVGLGAFFWFALPVGPSFPSLLLVLVGLATCAIIVRHQQGVMSYAIAGAALLIAGMVLADIETRRMGTVLLDTPVTTVLEGRVVSRDIDDRGRWRYLIQVSATRDPVLRRPPERVRVLARSRHDPLELGAGITGRARLSPPSGPVLPGLNDFAFDSYFQGTGGVGYFFGRPAALPLEPETGNIGLADRFEAGRKWLARKRGAIAARIRDTVDGDAGAIAAALVTAEERAIGKDTVEALRLSGLAHVLAISGLNMVLAAGTFLIGARSVLCLIPGLAHRIAVKKIAAAGALLMVTFYILISGGAVSAVRSYIMIAIMLIAVFFDRPSISLRNVAIAALLIIVVTPSAVTGPGFQMSFAATLALVAGYAAWRERPRDDDQPALHPVIDRLRPVGVFFAGLLLSSLIGGFSTLIYSVGHFHRIPAYGLMGNLIAMPIISIVVMPFGLIAMMLMPFGLDHYPLLIMGKGIDWMIWTAKTVAGWGGDFPTGRIPATAFVLIGVGGIVACLLRTRLAMAGAFLVAAGLVVLMGQHSPEAPAVVVSEDGELVGLIDDRTLSVNRAKPSGFIADQWLRALRLEPADAPVLREDAVIQDPVENDENEQELRKTDAYRKPPIDARIARGHMKLVLAETAKTAGRFVCVPRQWCAATTKEGWSVVTVDDVRFSGAACDSADIVVVRARVRMANCRSGALLVTGQSLRRSGALEIYPSENQTTAKGADRFQQVQAMAGMDQPWTRHRRYDWRTGLFDEDDAATETNFSEQ